MTVTATTTSRDVNRIKPGDGRLNPVNHIVRIVVVRHPDLKVASKSDRHPHSDDHPHSDGLTDEAREKGKEVLMKMPPPSSSERETMATSGNPTNMFEALKPTDIVVMGPVAASVRTVRRAGKAKTRELYGHDDRNKDTVLRVWTESDTIEYQCEEEFKIVRVERAGWKIYGAPEDPFGHGGPYRATPPAKGKNPLWVWRSGLLPARANNQQYKMTFEIGGVEIDPDVACGDPPPAP